MSKKLLLVGGGGHCKSVLDSVLELNEYDEIGIIDKSEHIGSKILEVPIIGCDDDLATLFRDGYHYAFVSVGSVGNPMLRITLFDKLREIGFEIPSVVDVSASISKYAHIDQGVYVGKKVIVNAGASIQKGSILNSGSIIEHDCQIGAFVHISPGAVLGGGVIVGDNSHIGLNATIKQQIVIGSNTMIGMGSVVLGNIHDNVIAYGNPCREVR